MSLDAVYDESVFGFDLKEYQFDDRYDKNEYFFKDSLVVHISSEKYQKSKIIKFNTKSNTRVWTIDDFGDRIIVAWCVSVSCKYILAKLDDDRDHRDRYRDRHVIVPCEYCQRDGVECECEMGMSDDNHELRLYDGQTGVFIKNVDVTPVTRGVFDRPLFFPCPVFSQSNENIVACVLNYKNEVVVVAIDVFGDDERVKKTRIAHEKATDSDVFGFGGPLIHRYHDDYIEFKFYSQPCIYVQNYNIAGQVFLEERALDDPLDIPDGVDIAHRDDGYWLCEGYHRTYDERVDMWVIRERDHVHGSICEKECDTVIVRDNTHIPITITRYQITPTTLNVNDDPIFIADDRSYFLFLDCNHIIKVEMKKI